MSDEPLETTYYLRLLSMYMDLGTEIVLDVFVYHTPGQDAETFIQSKQGEIIQLKKCRVLNRQQCDSLFQQGKEDMLKSPLDIKSFDISLLITLSRNLFTAQELEPPVKGWGYPPENKDKSVAADLLRLKRIRNVIVGHHPRAKLPLWRFENEWKNVSEILISLQKQIAPEKEVQLQTRIEAYRLRSLDPTVKNKYDARLKQWHQEVTTMQDQVEDLIKKLEGFEAYFNSKSDRFERYTKLLFKGGHFVLSAFLDKKINDDDRDLHKMLMDNEDDIRKVISDEEQLDKLYPSNSLCPTSPIDTSSWDVSLLSTVILQLFTRNEDKGVILNIKKIDENYRNYANATLLALDSNAFEDYWTDLKTSINIVSYRLDAGKAECCYDILDECKKKIDETEFKTYMEELKTQGTQIKSFTETFKDVLKQTKGCLQEMITHEIDFKNPQVLELKMITLGSDDQKKKLAEEILLGVWNEALDRAIQSTDLPEVKKEVTQILDEIRKSKSVKNISVRAKCILLQMTCLSPREMLDVIYYFESQQFHETLKIISIELGYCFDSPLLLYSVIPIECLWRICKQTTVTVHNEEGGLSLPITVSSPAGMRHLASVFSSDKIANCTNSIADALSKHLDARIEVKAIADLKEFTHIFETDISSSDSCSDCSSMDSNIQDNPSPNQIETSTEDHYQIPEGQQTVKENTNYKKGLKDEYSKEELRGTKRTLHETYSMSVFKKQKHNLEEETKGMEDKIHLCLATDKHLIDVDDIDKNMDKDKEEVRKRKQDIKHLYNPETSPSKAGSSQEIIEKTSISGGSEQTSETIALLELYQSQVAVSELLELAFDSLIASPIIAREILSTSKFAKAAQETIVSEYVSNAIDLSDMMRTCYEGLFTFELIDESHELHARKVRDKAEESKKRYIELQTDVKRNIQQVEHSICSEQESGEDKHTFKEKMDTLSGLTSEDESSSKSVIAISQHIFAPEVTRIHQFKDVNEEKLNQMSEGLKDIDFFAKKTGVEKTVLHMLRPGLAFTGGIALIKLRPLCYELFTLVGIVDQLGLQRDADMLIRERYCTDTKTRAHVDHIVIQRRKEFDRLEKIQKQEKNKGLECLNEVTRHLKNIDTQLTRMINYWSELANDIKFLLQNEEMMDSIKQWNIFDSERRQERRQEWIFVRDVFSAYADINRSSAASSNIFVKTSGEEEVREEEVIKRKVQLKRKKQQKGNVSETKRSDLKSFISEIVDKRSDLK